MTGTNFTFVENHPAKREQKTFMFIDNATIDPLTRQTIRSRVMIGRNAGRVLPPRPKRRPAPKPVDTDAENAIQRKRDRSKAVNLPPRVSSFDLLGVPHAGQISPEAKGVSFHFLRLHSEVCYPPDICHSTNEDYWWFEYFFHEEAFYHVWAASSQLAMNLIFGKGIERMGHSFDRHFTTALRLTNKRISEDRCISNVAIACVEVLCCIALKFDNREQSKMHLEGLSRMIQLRGGLEHLEKSWFLAQEAQLFDIAIAFQQGWPPLLKPKTKPLAATLPYLADISLETLGNAPLLDLLKDLDQEVYDATEEVLKVSYLFNSRTHETRIKTYDFREISIQLRYRLLEVYTDSTFHLKDRISMTIFLGLCAHTISYDMHPHPVGVPFKKLFKSVKAALLDPVFVYSIDLGTQLWLLMTVAISVTVIEDRDWLIPQIKAVAAEYGRDDWEFVREVLRAYPWVGGLHDEAATAYWKSIFKHPNFSEESSNPGILRLQQHMMKHNI